MTHPNICLRNGPVTFSRIRICQPTHAPFTKLRFSFPERTCGLVYSPGEELRVLFFPWVRGGNIFQKMLTLMLRLLRLTRLSYETWTKTASLNQPPAFLHVCWAKQISCQRHFHFLTSSQHLPTRASPPTRAQRACQTNLIN